MRQRRKGTGIVATVARPILRVSSGIIAVGGHAPNTVFLAYLRQTRNLLTAAGSNGAPADEQAAEAAVTAFVDGPFAQYMPLLAQEQQVRCPELFCQRLAVQAANLRGQATPPDDHAKARLAAIMAMTACQRGVAPAAVLLLTCSALAS